MFDSKQDMEELQRLVKEYNRINSDIDLLDSEPDSPRKDRRLQELYDERIPITMKLDDIFQAVNYPNADQTDFYSWLSEIIDMLHERDKRLFGKIG